MADQDAVWEPVPSYSELVTCIYNFTITSVRDVAYEKDPSLVQQKSYQYFRFSSNDVLLVIFLAFVFTAIRSFLTEWCFKPLCRAFELTPENSRKMPESAWKFLFFTCSWNYAFYVVVLSGKYRFFQSPSTVWNGWEINLDVPRDIYWLYAVQCGFYIHFSYASIFLDARRKDFVVILIHHVITIALILISYSFRYHNIGSLIFVFHDISDVFMEFGKLNIYFKIQGGKIIYRHELLANVTFSLFCVAWFAGRLYYFPLKHLYTGTCDVERLKVKLPYIALVNVFLWMLQILHIYWSMFIIKLLFLIASGKVNGAEDIRESDKNDFVEPLPKKTE